VRGYAALFGKRSLNIGTPAFQFYEVIERGAFDAVLQNDVRALFNHDANQVLGRLQPAGAVLAFPLRQQTAVMSALPAIGCAWPISRR
jgi:HK97 family phage prohead protease